jgi:predicted RNA-binding Zn-ribbon protein involved in translation (DUF1610 family)
MELQPDEGPGPDELVIAEPTSELAAVVNRIEAGLGSGDRATLRAAAYQASERAAAKLLSISRSEFQTRLQWAQREARQILGVPLAGTLAEIDAGPQLARRQAALRELRPKAPAVQWQCPQCRTAWWRCPRCTLRKHTLSKCVCPRCGYQDGPYPCGRRTVSLLPLDYFRRPSAEVWAQR